MTRREQREARQRRTRRAASCDHQWGGYRHADPKPGTRHFVCGLCAALGERTRKEKALGRPIRVTQNPTLWQRQQAMSKQVQEDAAAKGSVVYFVVAESLGRVKIGTTLDISQRMVDFKVSSPVPVRIRHTVPGDVRTEREFHKRFAAYRERGEWFRLEGDLLTYLDAEAP